MKNLDYKNTKNRTNLFLKIYSNLTPHLEGLEFHKVTGSLFRNSIWHGYVTRNAAIKSSEAVIDGITFTTTTFFGGIAAGAHNAITGKNEVWHNYVQWGFSWKEGFRQDGYNSGQGRVSPEDGLRLFNGVTAIASLGEITIALRSYHIAKNGAKQMTLTAYRYEVPDRVSTSWTRHKYNVAADHRYTGSGQGGVYAGTEAETALAEISHYGVQNGRVLISKDVTLKNVLDLTDDAVRKDLGVTLKDITSDGYDITQKIGKYAKDNGYDGILAPSARAEGGNNIVILKDID